MTPDNDDTRQPVTLTWALALTFVAWFLEVMLSMVFRPALARAGLQALAADALIRVVCYGVVFTVLMRGADLTYGRLLHEGRASVRATLGLLAPPLLLLVPLLLMIDEGLMWLLGLVLPMSAGEAAQSAEMMSGSLGSLVLTCLVAPVVEEMFFRGVLLRGMLQRYDAGDAVVYSSFVFGLAHLNLYQCVVAFLLGLLLASLYVRTRSLWPGIVLHAVFNAAVMAVVMSDGSVLAMPVWAAVVVLVAAGLGVFWLRRCLGPFRGWLPASR